MVDFRGPVPKRSTERRRRNKTDGTGLSTEAEVIDITQDDIDEKVTPEYEPDEAWHDVARKQWDAAVKSGQSIFYEPTDWAQLYMLCEELSRELEDKVIGFSEKDGQLVYATQPMAGAKMTALMKGFSLLMFTEGDRRRLRLELERGKVQDTGPSQPGDVIAFRRDRLG